MMAPAPQNRNFRLLMTLDAVGGVWRYALDLASGLKAHGVETVFLGFGPAPSDAQRYEAEDIGQVTWSDAPLDWMVDDASELDAIPGIIADLAARERVDFVHLNLPSQAAGLNVPVPIAVVSHSCVATWFKDVRGQSLPDPWQWQLDLTQQGFRNADIVLSPSLSHAKLLNAVYGEIAGLTVIPNASRVSAETCLKDELVFAAGRWWDEGKNGAVLDAAAAAVEWPVIMAGATQGPNGQTLVLRHADGRQELGHGQTLALMSRAAIFVSPSIYEPFGLAALEAARHHCAMVLADIPTYRELWEGAALFADPHQPQAFAEAINALVSDERLRQRLAAKAYLASERFSPEAQANAVMRHYGRLLHPMPHTRFAEQT